MEQGKIAIIGNICRGLGQYLFQRTASAFSGGFECFQRLFHQGFAFDVKEWARQNQVRGIVIGGSLKSPLNKDAWIREEEEFIRQTVSTGIPILGICFGHEILASAMGGALEKTKRMNMALARIEVLQDDPLFAGYGNGAVRSLMSHSVRVAALPADFVVLAGETNCPIAAMRHKELPVYGVQFHPEIDLEIKEHDPIWRVLDDNDILQNRGFKVLENFKKIVELSLGSRV